MCKKLSVPEASERIFRALGLPVISNKGRSIILSDPVLKIFYQQASSGIRCYEEIYGASEVVKFVEESGTKDFFRVLSGDLGTRITPQKAEEEIAHRLSRVVKNFPVSMGV